ncbi:transmembrane and coiled-coil domain protein 3 [Lates japonicus]|uniref:Transmembrane and coiled-coil domain protein 3 n=1 Tax=Lates japonicus TaxID=270547 RepID=A0AAD3RJ38_LATJO|nr:transmembrane and coiled-coil domain protein 3 [Lates japonicus]
MRGDVQRTIWIRISSDGVPNPALGFEGPAWSLLLGQPQQKILVWKQLKRWVRRAGSSWCAEAGEQCGQAKWAHQTASPEFANLIRNKFGSADNIARLKTTLGVLLSVPTTVEGLKPTAHLCGWQA